MTKDADDFNARQLKTGKLTIPHITELVSFWQGHHDLEPDGKAGPITSASINDVIAPIVRPMDAPVWPTDRCWPLRRLKDDRKPIITSPHGSVDPDRPNHHGADLLYRYLPTDPPKKIGDSGRTKDFWIPEETWAVASCIGRVVHASLTPTGFRVWIKIAPSWFLGYFHFDKLTVRVGDEVMMGTPLGRVNDNPKDTDPDHLHAELYHGDLDEYPRGTVDPEPFWRDAKILSAL